MRNNKELKIEMFVNYFWDYAGITQREVLINGLKKLSKKEFKELESFFKINHDRLKG